MKILHAPHEIAGQMGIISKAQRDLGHESMSITWSGNWLKYKCDVNLQLDKYNIFIRNIKKLKFFYRNVSRYEVYHFHFGESLLPFNIDLPILKLLNKKIIFHFWGSDIRLANHKHQLIKKYANKIIVASPDLIEYVPNSVFVPVALNLNEWKLNKSKMKKSKSILKIFHAPSNEKIKGTRYVLSAINKLKEEGYDIELMLIKNMPYKKVQRYYREADIVVDQLLLGWYGLFSVEMLSLNKPVLCFIREDLVGYAPDSPIINTNPDNLYNNLKLLIENQKLRTNIANKGRKYVEEVHDSKKIAKQLLELYESN